LMMSAMLDFDIVTMQIVVMLHCDSFFVVVITSSLFYLMCLYHLSE
jgi:hypothetical protein